LLKIPADRKRLNDVIISYNLVRVQAVNCILRRLAQTDNGKYLLLFCDKKYNYLHVNSAGNVYDRNAV